MKIEMATIQNVIPNVISHSVIGCHENKNGAIEIAAINGRYLTNPVKFLLLKKR